MKSIIKEDFLTMNSIEEYQQYLLKYFKLINDEFVKNKILWFARSGTLLGAIRHNGFVPWDDDIDMAMEFDEYEKNRELIKTLIDNVTNGLFELRDYHNIEQLNFDTQRIRSKKMCAVNYQGRWYWFNPFIDIKLGTHNLNIDIQEWKSKMNVLYTYVVRFRDRTEEEKQEAYKLRELLLNEWINLFTTKPNNKNKYLKLISYNTKQNEIYNIKKKKLIKFDFIDIYVTRNSKKILKIVYGDYKNYLVKKPHFVVHSKNEMDEKTFLKNYKY